MEREYLFPYAKEVGKKNREYADCKGFDRAGIRRLVCGYGDIPLRCATFIVEKGRAKRLREGGIALIILLVQRGCGAGL